MGLNEGQLAAKLAIESVLRQKKYSTLTIGGPAGTGKTFLLDSILQDNPGKYALTAPTNKATRVIARRVANNSGRKPIVRTIYSLLGLQLSAEGEVKELAVPEDPIDLSSLKGIFVDEGSMVNGEVFQYIIDAARDSDVPLIFLGDPYQLPPVKETSSRVWTDVSESYYLTQPVRFGGAILDYATALRSEADKFSPQVPAPHKFDKEGKVLRKISSMDFARELYGNLDLFFAQDEDAAKVICWRNITVDGYNRIIRQHKFGRTEFPFIEGDRIIFTEPYKHPETDRIIATTDYEGKVIAVNEDVNPMFPEFQALRITIESGDDPIFNVWTVHPTSERQYTRTLTLLVNEARGGAKHKWKDFWKLKEAFAAVRHAYAITAHRSQGSTYSKAFVNATDILQNRNRNESIRCLYVACTRPKHELILT